MRFTGLDIYGNSESYVIYIPRRAVYAINKNGISGFHNNDMESYNLCIFIRFREIPENTHFPPPRGRGGRASGPGAGLGAALGAVGVAVVGVAVAVPRRRAGAPRCCAAAAFPRLPAVRESLPPCLRRGAEGLAAQLLLHQRRTRISTSSAWGWIPSRRRCTARTLGSQGA